MTVILNEIKIELTSEFLKNISRYTQGIGQKEKGGILLGGFSPQGKTYIFTTASEPSDADYSEPSLFVRNKECAQKIIDKYWADSEGKINYLGEWHTHACKWPYPSGDDRNLMKMIFQDQSNVWQEIFMLIVGLDNTFYLGMANEKFKGEMVAEAQFEGE